MDSSVFYSNPGEVAGELRQRHDLRRVVEKWWSDQGVEMPAVMRPRSPIPLGLIARQVPTFRYEDAAAVIIAESAGLRPVWLGLTADKFVDVSPMKRSLVQPKFVTYVGRSGGPVVKTVTLASFANCQGQALVSISGLVDFHRQQLQTLYRSALIGEMSSVRAQVGGKPENYYPFLLSLTVAHSVLLEDYHGGESGQELSPLTHRVFEPAFANVAQRFGVKPLIVKLPWWPELAYYPKAELAEKFSWRCHRFALRHLATDIKPGFP